LLLVYIATAIYFTGFDTYFTYLGNYLIHYLGFTADKIGLVQGIPLVLAMLIAVPISNLINKNLHFPVTLTAVASAVTGMLIITSVTPETIDTSKVFNAGIFFAILLLGIGYVIMLQTTKAWTKELCPQDSKGQFEGIWCISYALLPMIFGSLISHFVIKETGLNIDRYLGIIEYIPNENIFIVGVIISTFCLIPLYYASKKHKKRLRKQEFAKKNTPKRKKRK
jgi:predicted MFS family arabinose efflux permease